MRCGPLPRAGCALAAICTWAVLGLGIYLHPGLDQDAVQAGAMIPGWFIGDAVRTRRRYRQSLARESDRQASETEARIRAEERLHLSRDVHDVVSHSLSMIAVRSGVARLVLDERPGEARAALAAIETAGRSALDEVRQLLRQIREPSEPAASHEPITSDIPDLVRRFQENGLDLTYHCTGHPGSYGGSVEMSAYRIAQEALTNVTRHAPAARATLQIMRDASQLTITVTGDGSGRARSGPGGMAGQHGPGEGRNTAGSRRSIFRRCRCRCWCAVTLAVVPAQVHDAGPPHSRNQRLVPARRRRRHHHRRA
jgi:signal transduction histidine kinase